jgi:hypothetical protein
VFINTVDANTGYTADVAMDSFMLRVCLSCALLFVEWPQAASPLSRTLQPAPHGPMVRSVFVSYNNKGRQRVYIDSHYLDNIDDNAVIINVHLCSYSEQVMSPGYALLASY